MRDYPFEWEEDIYFCVHGGDFEFLHGVMLSVLQEHRLCIKSACSWDGFSCIAFDAVLLLVLLFFQAKPFYGAFID